jgi:hypothetical protein
MNAAVQGAVTRIEKDFYSNSSRAARSSKRKTAEKVLHAGGLTYPLTPCALKFLAGTLRESGYKSAYSYIIEAKVEHVERGHNCSALLDRHFKLCMKAAKRGVGPRIRKPPRYLKIIGVLTHCCWTTSSRARRFG